MQLWKKLAIVAAVVLIIALTRASFHWTRSTESSQVTSGFSTCSVDTSYIRTSPKVGIVTMPVDKKLQRFQQQLVSNLSDRISKEYIVHHIPRTIGPGATVRESSQPIVHVYSSMLEAEKSGDQFLILVKPKVWHYSMNLISRNWSARVTFRAGSPRMVKQECASHSSNDGPYDWFSFNADYSNEGNMFGLFSTSYLTSSVVDSIAKSLVKSLSEDINDEVDKHLKSKREN